MDLISFAPFLVTLAFPSSAHDYAARFSVLRVLRLSRMLKLVRFVRESIGYVVIFRTLRSVREALGFMIFVGLSGCVVSILGREEGASIHLNALPRPFVACYPCPYHVRGARVFLRGRKIRRREGPVDED